MLIGAKETEKSYKNLKLNEDLDFHASRWELASVWGFSGQLQYSELFYGYYTNDTYSRFYFNYFMDIIQMKGVLKTTFNIL